MTLDERAAAEAELAELRRKLAKRRDMPGYAQNVREIEARMGELEGRLAGA